MVCTFFGHRDTPHRVKGKLKQIISELIEKEQVSGFYVGNQGGFDFLVRGVLGELKEIYPEINYSVVLAYMPRYGEQCENTIYPEGIENTPPKFAIDYRNRWMIDRADFVVTYVCRNFGGAAKFKEMAERKGKKIINLAEIE